MTTPSEPNAPVPYELFEPLIATCVMTPDRHPLSPVVKWGVPLNVIGPSGCGKSERIEAACAGLGLPVHTVYPASMVPEDFRGVPVPDGVGGAALACTMSEAKALIELGRGVLFIDELSTAGKRVQGAALGLVNNRRVGNEPMPYTVRVLCAMNPPEIAAGGFDLTAPMSNRLMHVDYTPPSGRQWSDWKLKTVQPYKLNLSNDALPLIQQEWNKHWNDLAPLMTGFVQSKEDAIHAQPGPDDAAAGGAWPSHRMWNWAWQTVVTSRCLGMPRELEDIIIRGCVGKSIWEEYAEWVRAADLPTPQQALTVGWRPDPMRQDIVYAVFTSCAAWLQELTPGPDRDTAAVAFWKMLDAANQVGLADHAVPAAKALVNMGYTTSHRNKQVQDASRNPILYLGSNGFSLLA